MLKNNILLCLNSFVQECQFLVLFENGNPTLLNGIETHVGVLIFEFTQFQIIKLICVNLYSYSVSKYSKYCIFQGYPEFYQVKCKIVLFILFSKHPECLNSFKNYLSIISPLKSTRFKSFITSQ